MAQRAIVVTAADEPYAALAADLFESLAPHRGKLGLDVGLLDLGLEAPSRERLARSATHVVVPPWSFRPHAQFDSGMKWRARAARPFLRDLFPGYDTYAWLDADTFVQSPLALKWLLDLSAGGAGAVVPAVDRSYVNHPQHTGWIRERYRMAFGDEVAARLMKVWYVNSGVLGFSAQSDVWEKWAKRFQLALDRWDGDFLSDQAVLNATLVLDGVLHARLPSLCNWLCHLALPRWYGAKRIFVEPDFPFAQILIVHNTPVDKTAEYQLLDEKAQPVRKRLAFSALRD